MATTIFDVARKSGVSTATVSRVLNGNMHVAPELAAKVMGAARELNYRPNRVARSLRLRHNRVLALVISDVRTGPFFADVVRGVEDGAHAAGYPMFLCNADEDPEKEAGYLHLAIAENVAGVILTPSGPGTDLRPLFDAGIQVVLADRKLPGNQADTVVGDNLSGATEAVSHLIANGYRRIACITGPLAATTSAERLLGYRMALQQAGITLDDSLVCVADFREAGGTRPCKNYSGKNAPLRRFSSPTTGWRPEPYRPSMRRKRQSQTTSLSSASTRCPGPPCSAPR